MTLADICREKGRQIGFQKGEKRGLEKSGAAALSVTAFQMLIEKFGKIPLDVKEGILSADTSTLQFILVNGFKFKDIDEVREYVN